MRKCLVLALLTALAAAPSAGAKGIDVELGTDPGHPVVGQQVRLVLTAIPEYPLAEPCLRMRIVVVAPGVSVKRALRAVEGGREPGRLGEWDAFRLASLRSTAKLEWTGRLRPNRPGRWTLVVPNLCVAGYVLPAGAARFPLDVRAGTNSSAYS